MRYIFDDESGRSPLDLPAVLVFEIDYAFDAAEPAWTDWRGDRYPGCDAHITILSVRCAEIGDDADSRQATPEEATMIGDWFAEWLETRAGWGERERVEEQIHEEHAA
jgi:hypothetical protein